MTAPACDVCGFVPTRTDSLTYHLRIAHVAEAQCPECDHIVRAKTAEGTARYLATHLARAHGIGATPAPCTHERPHRHGTVSAYNRDHCRCIKCWRARNAQQNEWRKLKAYGRYEDRWAPAAPVRAHVDKLRALGLGVDRVADAAGVPQRILKHLVYGTPTRGIGPAKRISPEYAAALLAVPLDPRIAYRRNPTGTARRVKALIALGYSCHAISKHSGVSVPVLQRLTSPNSSVIFVEAPTAAAIEAAYQELWDTHPTGRGTNQTRIHAARRGFLPPLAWDDDTIDDPAAQPADCTRAPEGKQHEAEAFIEDLDWLRRTGTNPTEAAHRLGTTIHAIEQAARRHGRRDLANWAGTAIRAQRKAA